MWGRLRFVSMDTIPIIRMRALRMDTTVQAGSRMESSSAPARGITAAGAGDTDIMVAGSTADMGMSAAAMKAVDSKAGMVSPADAAQLAGSMAARHAEAKDMAVAGSMVAVDPVAEVDAGNVIRYFKTIRGWQRCQPLCFFRDLQSRKTSRARVYRGKDVWPNLAMG